MGKIYKSDEFIKYIKFVFAGLYAFNISLSDNQIKRLLENIVQSNKKMSFNKFCILLEQIINENAFKNEQSDFHDNKNNNIYKINNSNLAVYTYLPFKKKLEHKIFKNKLKIFYQFLLFSSTDSCTIDKIQNLNKTDKEDLERLFNYMYVITHVCTTNKDICKLMEDFIKIIKDNYNELFENGFFDLIYFNARQQEKSVFQYEINKNNLAANRELIHINNLITEKQIKNDLLLDTIFMLHTKFSYTYFTKNRKSNLPLFLFIDSQRITKSYAYEPNIDNFTIKCMAGSKERIGINFISVMYNFLFVNEWEIDNNKQKLDKKECFKFLINSLKLLQIENYPTEYCLVFKFVTEYFQKKISLNDLKYNNISQILSNNTINDQIKEFGFYDIEEYNNFINTVKYNIEQKCIQYENNSIIKIIKRVLCNNNEEDFEKFKRLKEGYFLNLLITKFEQSNYKNEDFEIFLSKYIETEKLNIRYYLINLINNNESLLKYKMTKFFEEKKDDDLIINKIKIYFDKYAFDDKKLSNFINDNFKINIKKNKNIKITISNEIKFDNYFNANHICNINNDFLNNKEKEIINKIRENINKTEIDDIIHTYNKLKEIDNTNKNYNTEYFIAKLEIIKDYNNINKNNKTNITNSEIIEKHNSFQDMPKKYRENNKYKTICYINEDIIGNEKHLTITMDGDDNTHLISLYGNKLTFDSYIPENFDDMLFLGLIRKYGLATATYIANKCEDIIINNKFVIKINDNIILDKNNNNINEFENIFDKNGYNIGKSLEYLSLNRKPDKKTVKKLKTAVKNENIEELSNFLDKALTSFDRYFEVLDISI